MRVLVVEDNKDLGEQLKSSLMGAGYVVDLAFDGEEGKFLGETEPYDVVVLDIGLPKLDGLKVIKEWRKAAVKVPVLILTARDSWSEKVEGLDAGADDYLTKPFKMEELLARTRALIRRATGNSTPELMCGDITLNPKGMSVYVGGTPIRLTALEFKLLSYMMHHKNEVISRTELTEHIYDQDFDRDSNTIEVFINRIRKKLGVSTINTIRGLGYRLVEQTKKE